MELVAVAAVADNLVIGSDGELPWESIPSDKRQYRARVAESPVILGRQTFESMRDQLPGAKQIVLSRSKRNWDIETAFAARTVEDAVELACSMNAETVYVLGGASSYHLFLPKYDRMILSRIPGEFDGDTTFPKWDCAEWELHAQTDHGSYVLEEWIRSE